MRKTLYTILMLLAAILPSRAQDGNDTGLFLRAVAELAEGQYSSAGSRFARLIQIDSTDDASRYYLGQCEMYLGRIEEAEKHFLKAVELDSANTWYLNALANLYSSRGAGDKAGRVFEILLKKKPSTYGTAYVLTAVGDAKMQAGGFDEALGFYGKALETDPNYPPAEFGRMEILRMQSNFPAYFSALNHFVHNDAVPENFKSDYLTALMDRVDSQFYWVWGEQLNRLVDECLEMHPLDKGINMLKLRMLYIKSDFDGVLEQCGRLESLGRANGDDAGVVEALSIAGDVSHKTGDDEAAFRYYDKALRIDPDNTAVLNNYAYFLSLKGKKLGKALKMSRRAVEQEPDNATYLDTLGWVLHLLGKDKEAKPLFKHAMIYGGKDSAAVCSHYARVLEALGEKDLASYYDSLASQRDADE